MHPWWLTYDGVAKCESVCVYVRHAKWYVTKLYKFVFPITFASNMHIKCFIDNDISLSLLRTTNCSSSTYNQNILWFYVTGYMGSDYYTIIHYWIDHLTMYPYTHVEGGAQIQIWGKFANLHVHTKYIILWCGLSCDTWCYKFC